MKEKNEKCALITFSLPFGEAEKIRARYTEQIGKSGKPMTFSAFIRKRFERLEQLESRSRNKRDET